MGLAAEAVAVGTANPRHRTQWCASGRGRIALSVWDSGVDTAPVVVFVPGTMTHPLRYAAALDAIAAGGVSVVGVHHTGHGLNPPVRRPLRLADLQADVAAAIGWADRRFGGPVVVSGSSQGGALALAAAADPRVRLAIPHNALLPEVSGTLAVTRLPRALVRHHAGVRAVARRLAAAAPGLPVPLRAYLDPRRVFSSPAQRDEFLGDPLALPSYPLVLLVDLLTADFSAVTDGSIRCPVVLLAAAGDRLFTRGYAREVAGRIRAPYVRLVTLDTDSHLLFADHPAQVAGIVLDAVAEFCPA